MADCRFCAWARIVRNSFVRSCIDVDTIVIQRKIFAPAQGGGMRNDIGTRGISGGARAYLEGGLIVLGKGPDRAVL